jgi:hypothetical protein
MPERTYIITVDPTDTSMDVAGLFAFLRSGSMFDQWWNHIPAVFMVKSDRRAKEILDAFRTYTKNAKLLVMEVNPEEADGWLSDQGWSWICKRVRERAEESSVV